MQYIPNINFVKTLDNPMQLSANATDVSKGNKSSSHGFSNILQVQLQNAGIRSEELVPADRNETRHSGKSSSEKDVQERHESRDLKNNSVNTGETAQKEKTKGNPSGSINESDAKVKDKIEAEPLKEKYKAGKADDIAFLLKTINHILEMLKGAAFDKKQSNEIKSTLLELKNSVETKNNFADKKSVVSPAVPDIKNLLDRLEKLVETVNDRSGSKKLRSKEFNFEKKQDAGIADNATVQTLRKQISNLIDEIKQHLNIRRQENAAYGNNEPDNKNINAHKVFNEVPANEKKENTHSKDNGAAFNFSSFRKETESAASIRQKPDAGYAGKRSGFGDQLDIIMQNAKVTMQDSRNGSFSIRLYPESLGKVNVNLSLEQGVLFGKFLVDSTDAKDALLENIQSVIDRLREEGISVGGFNVNVRDEKKPFFEYSEEVPLHMAAGMQTGSAGAEYESNSSYVHSGEIDMII